MTSVPAENVPQDGCLDCASVRNVLQAWHRKYDNYILDPYLDIPFMTNFSHFTDIWALKSYYHRYRSKSQYNAFVDRVYLGRRWNRVNN